MRHRSAHIRRNNAAMVLCWFLFVVMLARATQDWAPWTTLDKPAAMQCTLCVLQEAVMLGGRRDNGISNAVLAVDTLNPLVIQKLEPSLPVYTTGHFCARAGYQLYVTIQGSTLVSPPTADFDVYVSTFSPNLATGYSTGSPWTSIGKGHYNRSNAGFGASDSLMSPFIFGGLDANTGAYVPLIDAYNSSNGRWTPVGTMPKTMDYLTSCNCQSSGHRLTMVLVCQLCNPGPQSSGQIHVLNYNLGTLQFTGEVLLHDFSSYFLSMRSVSLSHYVILVVSRSNETSPMLWYYDLYSNALNEVTTADMPALRSHGSCFPIGFDLFFAGGVLPNGTLSKEVDQIFALPPVTIAPDHDNYTYFTGQNITFSLSLCQPGLMLRLATTPSCNVAIPGVADATCTTTTGGDGVAVLFASEPFTGSSICIAMGQCLTPYASRVPCQFMPNPDFETCLYNYCCWDSENQTCFAYAAGTNDELHYFLANVNPLSIVTVASSEQSPFVAFITSPGGIASCVALGLVVIIGVGGLSWKALRAGPSEEDEEGSSHPLDQHGKYKILCKLGQGGFGTVYLVARKPDAERFAMKYIVCKDEEERDYAIKEFELLYSSQGHPNMIRLIEMFMNWSTAEESVPINSSVDDESTQTRLAQKRSGGLNSKGSQGGRGSKTSSKGKKGDPSTLPLLQIAPKYVCIVMDYCPEGDLARYILKVYQMGAIVPEHMITEVVLRQCCSLLSHLHSLKPPIVHRDLKPENLLLRSNATEVVVTDFGLAQQIEKSYLTTRAGSLHYVAPECWKRHYTAAVDVWALGCIAYGMCTGRVTAETARVMFSDARDKNFERNIRHDLRLYSEKLRNIVMGMLQTSPQKRLTSQQILQALDAGDGVWKPPVAAPPVP